MKVFVKLGRRRMASDACKTEVSSQRIGKTLSHNESSW